MFRLLNQFNRFFLIIIVVTAAVVLALFTRLLLLEEEGDHNRCNERNRGNDSENLAHLLLYVLFEFILFAIDNNDFSSRNVASWEQVP